MTDSAAISTGLLAMAHIFDVAKPETLGASRSIWDKPVNFVFAIGDSNIFGAN